MNKVLIYERQKLKPLVYDVSSTEKRLEAFQDLFKRLERENIFSLENRLEKQEKRFDLLKNPAFEDEDFVFVDVATLSKGKTGYVDRMTDSEWQARVDDTKAEIARIETRIDLKNKASGGDREAAEKLLRL